MLSMEKTYGLSERMGALKDALRSIKGISDVEFDLSGYLDDIYEVIVTAKYDCDFGEAKKNILTVAKKHGLKSTGDEIEDMGEHIYVVLSSEKWNDNREYALYYDYNGHKISVGCEGYVPNRLIANRLLSYHKNRRVNEGKDIYIEERIKERLYLPMKRYNNKPVYNTDFCYYNALVEGDYVSREIYNHFVDSRTPACFRSDCIQLGEPQSMRFDEKGRLKDTFLTIKKVTDDVWEFCGDCFRGENVKRGEEFLVA